MKLRDIKEIIKYSRLKGSLRPATKQHYVGIEVECVFPMPYRESRIFVSSALKQAGLDKKVRIGDDGSIRYREGHSGLELRVIDKESNIKETVTKLCEVLKSLGCYTNKSCGLHVHLDMRHRSNLAKEVIANNLVKSQDFLFSLVDKNRKGNKYTQKIDEKLRVYKGYKTDANGMWVRDEFGDVIHVYEHVDRTFKTSVRHGSHHHAINFKAYTKHKTIEVRIHEGTVNANKINNWIGVLLTIVNKKVKFKNSIPLKTKGFKELGL